MFVRLFFLFSIVPVIELGLLIYVGGEIGVFNTVAIVLLTAVAGAYMVRQEGIGVVYRIQNSMADGIFPAEELLDGAMVLVAGVLLLTPGFVTDLLGFLCVFPASRGLIKASLKRYLKGKVVHIQPGPFQNRGPDDRNHHDLP